MKTVLFAANSAWNLNNFRAAIIDALVARGDRVIAVCPDDRASRNLQDRGCSFHPVTIDPKGVNPVSDLLLMRRLRALYSKLDPDIALHFTIKPVIYGTIAARAARVPVLNTITGLGTAFIRQTWITHAVELLYRRSLAGPRPVIFQNPDDLAVFRERRLVTENPCILVPGSGVDVDAFPQLDLPDPEPVNFLMISRLLADKGIVEFVDAARVIRGAFPQARFKLLGPLGIANRTAIASDQVESWVREGVVDYLGEAEDIRPHVRGAHCIVLPSYREGFSRVLLEACAMGRPIIATEVPGCREIVIEGVNGFLCRPRDAEALAGAMHRFLDLDSGRQFDMAAAARARAVEEFDSRIVVGQYLDLIDANARQPTARRTQLQVFSS